MGGFADDEHHDGLGLAALVRRGAVSPTDLLDAALTRLEARNARVNAVVTRLEDHARQAIAAGLPDGPFRGVPFLLKDLTASPAGSGPARLVRSSPEPRGRAGCNGERGSPRGGEPCHGATSAVTITTRRSR
jgi:hypothetical protein